MTTRKEILKQAEKTVCTDREGQYGSPEDNFRRIADLWTTYCGGYSFEPKDVAMMMSLLKIARIATGKHKDDNYIDLAGYAACGAELGALEPREPDTLPEDCSLDGLEIVVHIVGDEVTDCGGLEAESDKEYIKKLSQTVSQLTEELEKEKEFCKMYKSEYNHLKTDIEKVKNEKSEACSLWEKTYDEMVKHYKDEIDVLKDKNATLYQGNLNFIEDYRKANEEIEKLKQEIDKLKQELETRSSVHNDRMNEAANTIMKKDDEITKLRTELDMWKGGYEKFKNESKELKRIRDDVTSELLKEREESKLLQDAMDIIKADRDMWAGKYKALAATVTGKDTK